MNTKQQLIIIKGLPGSGKSTWAKAWVLEDPKNRVRVNRDDIRKMLGPYWIPTRENLVTLIEDSIIVKSLASGFSVVVDATNLKGDQRFDTLLQTNRFYEGGFNSLEVKDFTPIPIETCIAQDLLRPKEEQVGEEVIRNMYNKYLKK